MKIAILISGEFRTFEFCSKTLTFLHDPNVDIYFSTWDKRAISWNDDSLVTHNQIKELTHREDVIVSIGNSDNFGSQRKFNERMLDRWVAGFSLILDNVKTGSEYSHVLIARPDLCSDAIDKFDATNLHNDKFNLVWANTWDDNQVSDIFFGSSLAKMIELFSSFAVADWVSSEVADWHVWWTTIIKHSFKDYHSLDHILHHVFLCRANVTNDMDICAARKCSSDWDMNNEKIGYLRPTIEILLAGEFRTGSKCAEHWKKIPNSNITLIVDTSSEDNARTSYPNSRIIPVDFVNSKCNVDNILARWHEFLIWCNFADDQLIIVSRPDLYLFDISPVLHHLCNDALPVMISHDDELKTGNDTFFVMPFKIFKRLISESANVNTSIAGFPIHQFMYFAAKKFNAINPEISSRIFRSIVPTNIEITLDNLVYYDKLFKGCLL